MKIEKSIEVIMRLNLLSEEKSVSAGNLFHVLITRSQKKVYVFRLECDDISCSRECDSGKGESAAECCAYFVVFARDSFKDV